VLHAASLDGTGFRITVTPFVQHIAAGDAAAATVPEPVIAAFASAPV